MNERTRREKGELSRRDDHWPHANHLVRATEAHAVGVIGTDDAKIREALNVVLGWADLLAEDILEGAACRKAVDAIERNARALRKLPVANHAALVPAVEAALRMCADLRASGRV